jgi:signal transduction histidine kinase
VCDRIVVGVNLVSSLPLPSPVSHLVTVLRPLAFRKRLLLSLAALALVPAIALTIAWSVGVGKALPRLTDAAAWEQVAASGSRVFEGLRETELSPAQRANLEEHEQLLGESLTQANRLRFVVENSIPVLVLGALVGLALLGVVASRVAGHLSRQLSRPLNELVGWTELIAHDQPLPPETRVRGAPEFETLRQRMREMAAELQEGREQAVEAERGAAFRESARRFAHELKNPLTPIQFALARLEREAPPHLADFVDVMKTETSRLDQMARAFSQFGRLPEGPVSDIDIGELVRYTARATIPPTLEVSLEVPDGEIMVRGHHDALQRALANVLLNAADACGPTGTIRVAVERATRKGRPEVVIRVRDTGPGIPAGRIQSIWEPYVTNKPGGTGLGLAIARQAILAHDGCVEVDSSPGSGTEFMFRLPVAPSGAVDGPPNQVVP